MPRVCLAKPIQADPFGKASVDGLAGNGNELCRLPPGDVSSSKSGVEVEASLICKDGLRVAMAAWSREQ